MVRGKNDIPDYSRCCRAPVLARGPFLYCHRCGRVVWRFDGPRRARALAKLRWERPWPGEEYIGLFYRNIRLAYCRDVPSFRWTGSEYICSKSTYKWFIDPTKPVGYALGIVPECPESCARYDFPTLEAAWDDLIEYLRGRGIAVPSRPLAIQEIGGESHACTTAEETEPA